MKSRFPDLVLVLVTLVWGCTFAMTQAGLKESSPFAFVMLRFAVAAIVLGTCLIKKLRSITSAELLAGLGVGSVVFAAYALQTLGLQHTTSSKSAFITASYVPLVPILQWTLFRRRPTAMAMIGGTTSFLGLILLASGDGLTLQLGLGEWLTMGCAVASALQIILIGRYAPTSDPIRISAIQIATVAALAGLAMPFNGEVIPPIGPSLLLIVLAMGILGTAVVIGAMNWAQKTVPPMRATLIYALEPVWAGLLGLLLGESFTTAAAIGSGLILVGIVLAELRIKGSKPAYS